MRIFFWLLYIVASDESDKEGEYFLYDLSSYAVTALTTREFALCYMRDTGVHGCKVVPLTDEKVANLQRLNFSSPESGWGTSEHAPPLLTRGIADDIFVLCAKPECMVVQRRGEAFIFSAPQSIEGKLISLTMTQSLYEKPALVSACVRTYGATKNSLFDINVDCTEYEVHRKPLAIGLPGTIQIPPADDEPAVASAEKPDAPADDIEKPDVSANKGQKVERGITFEELMNGGEIAEELASDEYYRSQNPLCIDNCIESGEMHEAEVTDSVNEHMASEAATE